MEALLADLLAEIAELAATGNAGRMADRGAAAPPADVAAILEKLAHALEHDLGAAEDLMEQLRGSLTDSRYRDAVAEIGNKLDRFAIDDAQIQLAELRLLMAQG